MKAFNAILSSLRRETGFSQRYVANELGVSQALLSHYENGAREPKLEFVIKACDYYGVTADYLLGRSDERGSERPLFTKNLAAAVSELQELQSAGGALIEKMKRLMIE